MAQGLLVRGREQVEEWGLVGEEVWEEWEEISLGQAPAEIVFAPVAGQRFLTRQAFPATT